MSNNRCLIFGARGTVGNHTMSNFTSMGINVIGTTSNSEKTNDHIIFVNNTTLDSLSTIEPVDIIIWAHGCNLNDDINSYEEDSFNKMIDGNVTFILNSLNYLLKHNKLNNNAKLVIVSSIWEEFTRDNKLSYTVSKSALGGLVKSLSYDLADKNILINNVLPGVIENEMSIKTLKPEYFNYIKTYTPFNRLISLDDVFNTIKFLAIDNTGMTGQSLKVDLGFTNIRKYC